MAKTLNQFLEGYLKVKNPDEQKFVDKHVVAKHADRNGNGDEVFKGSKVKMDDRRKTRHGYNPGEDEKVYEELKGNQHKIDHNKNGKIDAHDFKLLRGKKKVAEEAEELEELSIGTMKSYGDKRARTAFSGGRKPGQSVDAGIKMKSKQSNSLSLARTKINRARDTGSTVLNKEEAKQIDELSQDKLMGYRAAAKKQGTDIQNKMKVGGGDWSKDGKDTDTLKKRMAGYKMAGRKVNPGLAATVGKAPRVAATEEVQIDELSNDTLRRYRMKAKSIGDNEKGDINYRAKGRELAGRKTYGGRMAGIEKAKVMAKEETENLDETAKIVAHLQKRYGDNIRKSHVRSAANDFGVDASKLAKAVRTKLGKNMLDEEENDEGWYTHSQMHGSKKSEKHPKGISAAEWKSGIRWHHGKNKRINIKEDEEQIEEKLNMDKASMGDVITDFKDSNAPQFKGKSQDKRRAMAIAAKLTAERGGKPLRKEEKLADLLGDLTETHRRTMLSVFDKLNEDNQKKFLEACKTPEGVDSMLDFAISHRGE